MIETRDLSFSYQIEGRRIPVLNRLNFSIRRGEFVAIQGPSGSGKSTLFYLLGLLLRPTGGKILFNGVEITQMSEDELSSFRNQKMGFIFQQFHLLPKMSAYENILLPTRYPSETATLTTQSEKLVHQKILQVSRVLGIGDYLSRHPNQLSGGQQQRIAIARALMHDVDLILADEPTGNLDSANAKQTMQLLRELNHQGKTIILITHDTEVAEACSRVIHLKDGEITDLRKEDVARTLATEMKDPTGGPYLKAESVGMFSLYSRVILRSVPLALENLVRNKIKSLLTMLGVVIGVAAVLAMVTLGKFTKQKILESYETLGVNQLMIRGYPNWNQKATDRVAVNFMAFDWEKDLRPLKRVFPEIFLMSPVLASWQNNATAGGLTVSDKVTAMGVSPEYMRISNRSFILGKGFHPVHIESRSPVCVIGFEIAERLFSRTHPIGQIVSVSDGRRSSFPCKVIGVLGSKTTSQDWSPPNRHVLLPYSYFQTVTDSGWAAQIHEVAIQVESGADVEAAGKKIRAYFEQKYGKSGVFIVDSDSTLIAQMKRFLNLFSVLLTSIALLSLLVGGIGINNMMLVSVSERIREFGIRKALGATNRTLRVQILMESTVLCAVAGLIGVSIGFFAYEALIFGATKFVPALKFEWILDPIAVGLSLCSILAVGIGSGLVPALKTEKLQIIEALRVD